MKNKCTFVTRIIGAFVLLVFGFSGYAVAQGYHYGATIQYDAAQADIGENLKAQGKARSAVIYVAEFVDSRTIDDKKEIGRVRERNDDRNPIFVKSALPGKAVSNGIKAYLKKAGYKVDDKIVQWDLNEENMPKGKSRLIIGGSIEEMEVNCWRGVFSHAYTTSVKMTVVFADSLNGKILYRGKVAASSSKNDASFSEEMLSRQISNALGDAIEKIFKEKNVSQKIQEVLK